MALMLPSLRLTGRPAKNGARNSLRHSYPTSYPVSYSAAILREEVDEVEKQFPKLPMVITGHSMGGCISRLLLTDSGDQLWMKIFGRPPDEVPLSPKTREYFRQELFFRHRPENRSGDFYRFAIARKQHGYWVDQRFGEHDHPGTDREQSGERRNASPHQYPGKGTKADAAGQ